jgi:uncharacterized protein
MEQLTQALNGQALGGTFVCDCHGHLDHWKGWFRFATDAESMVARMDRVGIHALCINKWNCPDIFAGNRDVATAVRRWPDRFFGFVATAPGFGRAVLTDELRRCFDEWGFRGIKVHNAYERLPFRDAIGLPEFEDGLNAVWEFAAARRAPVLCHGYVSAAVARRYPEARFLAAHTGGCRDAVPEYRDLPNVYFDTASSGTMRGNIEYLVEHLGAERVVFGTDMPYADPAYRLGQVITAQVPAAAMRLILGGNMARLLGLGAQATP